MAIDYFAFFNAVSPVSHEVMAKLVQAGREKVVARGELITREGQVQRDLLLVEAGSKCLTWTTRAPRTLSPLPIRPR